MKKRVVIIPVHFDNLKLFLLQVQATTEKRIPIEVLRHMLNSIKINIPPKLLKLSMCLNIFLNLTSGYLLARVLFSLLIQH